MTDKIELEAEVKYWTRVRQLNASMTEETRRKLEAIQYADLVLFT